MSAVEKFSKKELKRVSPSKRRRNKKPEEDVVVSMMQWYRENGFFMRRFEAKAKFIQGEWRQVGVEPGTPDLGGVCPHGYAHWNEVKAKGQRSTVRDGQSDFLVEVIKCGGFGIVADSVEYLDKYYNMWLGYDKNDRRTLLFNLLRV